MIFLLHVAAALPILLASMDLPALDSSIERCQRDAVLPIFSGEAQRRSEFVTAAYQEQAEISAERLSVATKRRALREASLRTAAAQSEPVKPSETDQELALAQLALDDRQRALDDRRRLETMRQDAVELKRQYFLSHCASPKKKAD